MEPLRELNTLSESAELQALENSLITITPDTKSTARASYMPYILHSPSFEALNPSEDAILDVMEKIELVKNATLKQYELGYNLGDGRFVKISGNGFEEARVMDFIRLHTSIPVPRIHMVFERKDLSYTVMDYIAGNTLEIHHQDSPPEELENIATQLSDIIRKIRAVCIPHQKVLGSWEATPFRNTWFKNLLWDRNVAPSNVFRSVEEFNSYWISRSKLEISLPDIQHVNVVPTHGDLNDRNIIIRDGQIVAILDWDTFGWYPDYWELIPTWNLKRRRSIKWEAALKKVFGPRNEFCGAYTRILDAAFREPMDYDPVAVLLQSESGVC